MQERMRRLAVFDIDGTLHRTEVMSLRACAQVMPRFGLAPPTLETLGRTYGCDTPTLLSILGVPQGVRAAFLAALEAEEARQIARVGECYPGALEMLRALHAQGVELALCSMCRPSYMEAFVARFALAGLLCACRNEGQGKDKALLLQSLLQERAPDCAVMVGDRTFDFDAARKNGIPSVGCLYGYAPQEAREGADVVARDTQEALAAVRAALRL